MATPRTGMTTGTTIITTMNLIDSHKLVRLMTFLSPAFPVGAFSYSHGLEQAIHDGAVRDRDSLTAWLTDILEHGSGWTDAVLLAAAYRACQDDDALQSIAELAAALAPSRERHLETMAQGAAFLAAMRAWPCAPVARLVDLTSGNAAYPVAIAAASAGHGIALEDALAAYLNAFATNLTQAAVRLVPLGQSEGLAVLAGLEPLLLELAARAASSSLNDLGAAAFSSDIASMRHETLYSRIFRS